MSDRRLPKAAPFLALGIAFLAIGATGRRAFVAIGAAFIVLALLRIARQR